MLDHGDRPDGHSPGGVRARPARPSGPARRAPRRGSRRGAAHPRRRADRLHPDRHPGVMGARPGRRRCPDFLRALRLTALPQVGSGRPDRRRDRLGGRLPAPPCPADPARLLGGRPHRPSHPQCGSSAACLAVDPVPAADPELRLPPLVERNGSHRAGPGLEPGRRGVLLPGPPAHRRRPHLVRLPRHQCRGRQQAGPAAAHRHRRPGRLIRRLGGPRLLPPSQPVVRGHAATPADLVLHRDGGGRRAGLGRSRARTRRTRRHRRTRRYSRPRAHRRPGRPVLPLGGRLNRHVRPDRRLRLRHRVHPADRPGIRRRPRALGDRVQDCALRPHRRGGGRARRVPAPAGRPGGRDALRPAAGQPPRPFPGPDLLRHLSLAVPRRLRVLRTTGPEDRVRRGCLHHARGRGHRGGHRPAHDRRRHRELLPDRAPGAAPADAARADVRAGSLAGLRQDLAPGR
jgi:hypothetical protein